MPTDYVLFIHGVNTREAGMQPEYANSLIQLIQKTTPIKPLVVYWGKANEEEEQKLRAGYEASPIWNKLWFQNFREQQLVRLAGDAALYLSRYIGAKVADLVVEQIKQIKDDTEQDRLHLVAHSLGSVILFDLLFSSRWDTSGPNANESVTLIRNAIYGATGSDPNPRRGIRLGSIITAGSPIGIFSLIDLDPPAVDEKKVPNRAESTHDITPGFVRLLEQLYQARAGQPLPWRNFVHPGDPIGSPLQGIIPPMLNYDHKQYIDLQDVLMPTGLFQETARDTFFDLLATPFSKTSISLFDGGNAHSSYWQSAYLGKQIAQLIQQARSEHSG